MPLIKKQITLSARFTIVAFVIVAVLAIAVIFIVNDLINIEGQFEKSKKTLLGSVVKNTELRQKVYQLTHRTQYLERLYFTDESALVEESQLIKKELQSLSMLIDKPQFSPQLNLFIEDLESYLNHSLTINEILEERYLIDNRLKYARRDHNNTVAKYDRSGLSNDRFLFDDDFQQLQEKVIFISDLTTSLGARIAPNKDMSVLFELEKEMESLKTYSSLFAALNNYKLKLIDASIVALDQYFIVLRELQLALSQQRRISDALLVSQASLIDAIAGSENRKFTESLNEIDASLKRITLLRNFIIGSSILIILLGAIFFTMIVRRHVNRPMNSLLKNIESFEAGNFKEGVKLNRSDEWYTIEKAFNKMVTRLDQSYSQLISERKSFDYMAHHDPLTGLANRLLAYELITNMIGKNDLDDHQFSLIYLDLDEFKQVNDSLGHAVGDELLIIIANKLHSMINTPDTAVRLGGDEFMVLVSGKDPKLRALEYAKRIIVEIKKPLSLHLHSISVGCSIGICHFPEHGDNVDTLIRNADTAMYQAKKIDGEKICIYEAQMTQVAVDLLHKISGIHQAIEKDEFFLDYQPKFNLATQQIIGVEALIRWQHPEFGVLYPDQFLTVAEQSGLLVDVDQWVFDEVLRQVKQWKSTLNLGGQFKVSVNFSGKKFSDPMLLDRLQATLGNTQCLASEIEIEITEQDLMMHIENSVGIIKQLKTLGFSIAIDDFGTGYSSFGYLKKLPVDTLKIDKIFINDVKINSKELAIVKTMLSLGSMLDLTVVAEGIETHTQKVLLESHGCTNGQGYLLAKPMSPNEFEGLFNSLLN